VQPDKGGRVLCGYGIDRLLRRLSEQIANEHGSWNRRPHSGYKLVFVPLIQGHLSGDPIDILTRFLDRSGNPLGRPVGIALDRQAALLVADGVGNRVWRVAAASPSQTAMRYAPSSAGNQH
jgi:hypothetical protein